MKCTVPEISWHNREPVLSVDFHYSDGNICRLATGGADTHIVIWFVTVEHKGKVNLEFAADLRRHNKAVNVVRFSPCEPLLASGDDEATIWLWKKVDKVPGDIFNEDEHNDCKEYWNAFRTLRGHVEDVCDLAWSPDGNSLISGSVDNTAILWDVHKGRNLRILSDHKGFVQGVAWDPKNKYAATLCSDRICRIYNVNNYRIAFKVSKAVISAVSNKNTSKEQTPGRPVRLFHDDTLKTFCRRLTFSPDGELLITPSGLLDVENGININTTYIFSRNCLNKPVLYFPTKDKYTVAVRCCPILFQLRSNKQVTTPVKNSKPWEATSTMFKLPYRIVLAVATQDSILLYDTQQPMPFGQISNIHYTRLSDLTWSKDGSILCVSSTDGYCSFVTFDEKELGIPYVEDVAVADSQLPSIDELPSNKQTNEIIPSAVSTSSTPERPSLQSKPQKKRASLVTLFSPKHKLPQQNCEESKSKQESKKPHASSKLEYPEDKPEQNDLNSSNCRTLLDVERSTDLPALDSSGIEIHSCMLKPNGNLKEQNFEPLISEMKETVLNDDEVEIIFEKSITEMASIATPSKQDGTNTPKTVVSPSGLSSKTDGRPPRRIQPILISKKSN